MQSVESVEELFLDPLLAREELDIVNQEHIRLPVILAKLHQ